MQFNQPPNWQSFYGYPPYQQTVFGPQYTATNTDIIGEGDVTSVVNPDGSLQFLFLPRVMASGPFPRYRNNPAWFIRTITNPYVNQQYPGLHGTTFSHPQLPQSEVAMPVPSYQLKFHNDCWTSTTDLHYFYPRLRQCEWIPKLGAAVQVELPTESANIYHYQVVREKPCLCQKMGAESVKRDSVMSVDVPKGCSVCEKKKRNKTGCACDISEPHVTRCECHGRESNESLRRKEKGKRTRANEKSKGRGKKSGCRAQCECGESGAKNAVSFADKSNGCTCDENCATSLQPSDDKVCKKDSEVIKVYKKKSTEPVSKVCGSDVSCNSSLCTCPSESNTE